MAILSLYGRHLKARGQGNPNNHDSANDLSVMAEVCMSVRYETYTKWYQKVILSPAKFRSDPH